MQLALLAERNKSSYVQSLANMVKADGAKAQDSKRIGKLRAASYSNSFQGTLLCLEFVFNFLTSG